MARLARIVVPHVPHHVTQRGNRRQRVFFGDEDYRRYLDLLREFAGRSGTAVWAYCLMPNHVHLVLVPARADGLHRTLQEAHRRYTRHVNFREGWRGYLWQGRFASYPMEETHLYRAVRYVEQNPVRARLVTRAEEWPWSSARTHLAGISDGVVCGAALSEGFGDWATYLGDTLDATELSEFRSRERTGRPLGGDAFVERLECLTGRSLRKQKPGPKPRQGRA